jgi:hypothetical protein
VHHQYQLQLQLVTPIAPPEQLLQLSVYLALMAESPSIKMAKEFLAASRFSAPV